MAADTDPTLLDLFTRELTYLRERGTEFALRYPKIAARLGVANHQVSDPHVERLLESFAFLTARLQHHLERDLPELSTGLLGTLYPQYTSPIPSMAIAAFSADPTNPDLISGPTIEKGTMIFGESPRGPSCRFATTYPVTLWPITVEGAEFVAWDDLGLLDSTVQALPSDRPERPIGALRIRLTSSHSFRTLGFRALRFFINGDPVHSSRLYDLLFERERPVLIPSGEGAPRASRARLRQVGFELTENVLAYPDHAHSGYRLLQEYFAFPRKFLFFDITIDGQSAMLPNGTRMDILIPLDRRPSTVTIRPDTFMLGCAPIVNLFARNTEPIRVDQRTSEYRLVADARRERHTEIHSVVEVAATSPGEPEQTLYAPFFSFFHPEAENAKEPRAFWIARRTPTGRANIPGSDVYLSFVNLDFLPERPWSEVVYAKAICTNRDLAEDVEAGAPLFAERATPARRITCLTKPTPSIPAPLGGQSLWRLVSNLSLSHIALEGHNAVEALRETLRAQLFVSTRDAEKQIAALTAVQSRTVQRRVGQHGWRGLCRGTELTLVLAEEQFGDSTPLLFAEVLCRFLALYAHLNSFTEVVLRSTAREEEWKRWPPMAGCKPLL